MEAYIGLNPRLRSDVLQLTRLRGIECGNKVGEKLRWRNRLPIGSRWWFRGACASRHLRYANENMNMGERGSMRQL